MTIEEIFNTYERATLLYSGGKDSLCCLLLCRPYWDRLDVVWVNTGCNFPEIEEHMALVKSIVPHFTAINSDVQSWVREQGFPVDVVPTRHTWWGNVFYGNEGVRYCDRFHCCKANRWDPLVAYVDLVKPACIIRGDRGEERMMADSWYGGARLVFPIFDWTVDQVHEVVRSAGALYQDRHELDHDSSLNCRCCMGFYRGQPGRMKYLSKHHPAEATRLQLELDRYKAVLLDETKKLF